MTNPLHVSCTWYLCTDRQASNRDGFEVFVWSVETREFWINICEEFICVSPSSSRNTRFLRSVSVVVHASGHVKRSSPNKRLPQNLRLWIPHWCVKLFHPIGNIVWRILARHSWAKQGRGGRDDPSEQWHSHDQILHRFLLLLFGWFSVAAKKQTKQQKKNKQQLAGCPTRTANTAWTWLTRTTGWPIRTLGWCVRAGKGILARCCVLRSCGWCWGMLPMESLLSRVGHYFEFLDYPFWRNWKWNCVSNVSWKMNVYLQ